MCQTKQKVITYWLYVSVSACLLSLINQNYLSSHSLFAYWYLKLCRSFQYGLAILRGVPTKKDQMKTVVERFAYIKQTQYGVTFDVINEPNPTHLAFSGLPLAYHTDMNYREKSPGMQLLHCLKVWGQYGCKTLKKSKPD